MGISRIFDISRRSMMAYQQALDVSSHNIANAGNPNYSRQRAVISTERPEQYGGITWGTGMKIDDIIRIKDDLTQTQILSNNQNLNYYKTQSELLGQVEQVFSEPSDLGLSNLMTSFFNSWSQLAETPNSTPLRNNVVLAAKNLSSKVQSVHEDLDLIRSDMFHNFNDKVDELNGLLKEVRDLNREVIEDYAIGNTPNDLMDKRDEAIEKLSKLANIKVTYDNNGGANVSIGGVFAADAANFTEFRVEANDNELSIVSTTGDVKAKLTGGEMAGLAKVYGDEIPKYKEELDAVVQQLMDSTNSIHSSGYSLDDPPVTGINFFSDYSNGVLAINDEILDDPEKISVSADQTSGNGDIATQLANLNNEKVMDGSTINEKYSMMISSIGNDKQNQDSLVKSQEIVSLQLETQRSSESGVSVDEEMINVIRFQRSYDASAKLIAIADEMLQTVLNII